MGGKCYLGRFGFIHHNYSQKQIVLHGNSDHSWLDSKFFTKSLRISWYFSKNSSTLLDTTDTLETYNNAMDEVSRHVPNQQFTPLTHQLNKSWENALEHERSECIEKAKEGMKLILWNHCSKWWRIAFSVCLRFVIWYHKNTSVSSDLIALMTTFRDTPTKHIYLHVLCY